MQTGEDSLQLSDSFAVQSLQITQGALLRACRCHSGLCSVRCLLCYVASTRKIRFSPLLAGLSATRRHFVPVSMAVCKGNATKSRLFKNRSLIKQRVQYSLDFYVSSFASRSQPHRSPAVLFLLRVPCDVPTTEGTRTCFDQVTVAHSAQPTACSQNEQERSLALALHKTCENVISVETLNAATNLAENGQCI